ncbi:MAG: sulfurtransferase, partial [Flavobacteriaceae bacterium]
IIISGPSTGNQELQISLMFVNGTEAAVAKPGDKVTLALPFRIRLSDKLYKVLD